MNNKFFFFLIFIASSLSELTDTIHRKVATNIACSLKNLGQFAGLFLLIKRIFTFSTERVFRICFQSVLTSTLLLGFFLNGHTQTTADTTIVNADQNFLEIVEVVYEVNGTFYTQDGSGDATDVDDFELGQPEDQDPVTIYKVKYTTNGGTTLFDIFPSRNDVNITALNDSIADGTTPPATNEAGVVTSSTTTDFTQSTYQDELEDIITIPDIRSYWTVNGNADLGGTGFVDFLEFEIFARGTTNPVSFDVTDGFVLVTERDGNSALRINALDSNLDIISGSHTIEINNQSGDLYQWDTTIQNDVDPNGTQPQWLLLFDPTLFNTGGEAFFGLDIDFDFQTSYADGSILGFRNPNTQITVGDCWRTLSSTPIDGATYDDLLGNIWTQGVPGSDYPSAAESNVLLWDTNVSGNTTAGWTTTGLDLNDEIPAGTGFLLSVFADDDFDGLDPSDDFPKTLSVTGQETSGSVSPTTMNSNPGGWTLLGNPYGAPIDWNDVTANSGTSNITNVAYVYDRNKSPRQDGSGEVDEDLSNTYQGGWVATNGTGAGDLLNGLIAPFQGFFVQNDGTTNTNGEALGQVEMQLDDRSPFDFPVGTGDEWKFYGKSTPEHIDHIRLAVEGEQVYDSAWISLADFGSKSRIKGDAYELMPFSENYTMLSTRKGDELFDIGQFKYDESLSIPLNMETTVSGSYTLRVSRFDTGGASDLVFTDTQKNVTLPLNEDFEYEFEVRQAAKANPDPLR
ncbi:MAG: hypothetical protein GVY20_01330, partial [Bacteroidetes bacterium]|nr:hypothetical protein [Bacteroidota bacterium]